jgi:hypothetical protein
MCLLIIAVTPFIIFVLFREIPDYRMGRFCHTFIDIAINIEVYPPGKRVYLRLDHSEIKIIKKIRDI